MKVRDIIKLLERDGWYLKKRPKAVIDNTSTRPNPGVSRYRAIPATIWHPAR